MHIVMRYTRRPFWIYAVLLLAILVRAAIPAGYMPDLKTHKPFTMVVCGLNGPQTVTMDAAFDPTAKKTAPAKDHKATSLCEFASLSHTPFLGAVADFIVTRADVSHRVFLLSEHQSVVAAFAHYNSARGPPVISV